MKAFKIRPYRDPKRPHLKFVVNATTVDGEGRKQRARSFFETRAAATGFAQQKSVELANGGLEAVQFPAALRVMTVSKQLQPAASAATKLFVFPPVAAHV